MIEVNSNKDFISKTNTQKEYWLFLYKKSSETGECAYESLKNAELNTKDTIHIYAADVNKVRDIHALYNITSVPSLLKFDNSEFQSVYKGCNDSTYYENLFSGHVYSANSEGNETKQKNVMVYSTPTCSWCTRLKNYLKENNIKFKDIDVSKDQKAAEEMVKRSGQQGVPQSIIGGQVIIGFDKAKIDNLLGL